MSALGVPAPLKVLILEDSQADAELVVAELRRAGYAPDWQRVESEADYLSGLDPALDVILADYHLPQFDALRALRLMQERGLSLPFIVVTGALGDELAAECVKRGAADYLIKDRIARLGPAVDNALERQRLSRAEHDAQLARQASEERYRKLFQEARDALYISTLDGRIVDVNQSLLDLFGYDRERMLAINTADLYADPSDREKFALAVAVNGYVKDHEVNMRRADGTEIVCQSTSTLRKDGDGQVAGYHGMIRDVTEIRQMQLQERRLQQELTEQNRELGARVHVITALNRLFQRHLRERSELIEACRTLVVDLERSPHDLATIVQRVRSLPIPAIEDIPGFDPNGGPGESGGLNENQL